MFTFLISLFQSTQVKKPVRGVIESMSWFTTAQATTSSPFGEPMPGDACLVHLVGRRDVGLTPGQPDCDPGLYL